MNNLTANFLVASPHLSDPNFLRSVVLMVQHDDQGAFGLILNRRTENSITEIWDSISDDDLVLERKIQHGGPVDGLITALHTNPSCSQSELLPGLYFTADQETLSELVHQSHHSLMVFAGYSGWASGQLETEIEAGGWLTATATVEEVFSEQTDLWHRVARRIGLEILAPSLRGKQVPRDPSLN